jgi:threonyl-tRNA synthetase
MLVVGDREAAERTVAVRSRSEGDKGARSVEAFIADALEEISHRSLSPKSSAAVQQPA